MEVENKYYEKIKERIEINPKIIGREVLIEDIIDNIYKSSIDVIKNINDKVVLDSFLDRLIGKEIVKVVKSTNFHPEIKHKLINRIENIQREKNLNNNKDKVKDVVTNKSSNFDLNKNDAVATSDSELTEKDTNDYIEVMQNDSEEALLDNIDTINNITDASIEFDNNFIEENFIDNTTQVDNTPEENLINEQESDNLWTSMSELVKNIDTIKSSETLDSKTEIYLDSEQVFGFKSFPNEEFEKKDNLELSLENIADDSEKIEEITDLTPTFEDIQTHLDNSEVEFDSENEELLVENAYPQENDEFDIEDNDNTSYSFKINYGETPVIEDYIDIKKIQTKIVELNNKYPMLNILNIYDMKYKEGLAIAEIAQSLSMEEDDVLKALMELIAIV